MVNSGKKDSVWRYLMKEGERNTNKRQIDNKYRQIEQTNLHMIGK